MKRTEKSAEKILPVFAVALLSFAASGAAAGSGGGGSNTHAPTGKTITGEAAYLLFLRGKSPEPLPDGGWVTLAALDGGGKWTCVRQNVLHLFGGGEYTCISGNHVKAFVTGKE